MGFRIHQVAHATHVVEGSGGGVVAYPQLFPVPL